MTLCQCFTLPSVCRLSGTVMHKIWPKIIFFALYATALVCVHTYVPGIKVDIPQTLIPVLGFVTGLLLVFRTNTAYDRYWEGRKLWSQITQHARVLTRFVWVTVPEKDTEDLLEKLSVINLIVAFPYAVKNYLRGNYSYEADDLRDLIAHLPRVVPSAFNSINAAKNAASNGKVNGAFNGDTPSINGGTPKRPHLELRIGASTSGSQANLHVLKMDKGLAHETPTDTNIPIEIILYCTSFVNKMVTKVPPLSLCSTNPMNASLTSLSDALSGLERILETPIPLAYAVHLDHILWLYLLALPYQLIGQLNWWTIPAVAVIAFALLGILDIGLEIENPFGTDFNDLPVEQICDRIKHEAYMTVGTSFDLPNTWVMTDENHPLWPMAGNSAADLSNKSLEEVHELLSQRAQALSKLKS